MELRRTTLVGAILMLPLLLVACASAAAEPSPTQSAQLLDTEWVLVALNGNALIEGTRITLNFDERSVAGSAGCNKYGGSYTASEDGLHLGDLYATEMGCPEPQGVLDQETAYLQALNAAARIQLADDRLEVVDPSGAQILVFVASTSEAVRAETPTVSRPIAAAPTMTPVAVVATNPARTPTSTPAPTSTAEVTPVTPATVEPAAGFRVYRDAVAGVAIHIPESWVVTGIIPGQYAILQSYPEDKYVGGGGREPGDTKCDLNIRPVGSTAADLIQQWKSSPRSEIVSEGELVLQSGQVGARIEVESLGRSLSLISDVNARAVALTCYGDFELFDAIAVTLSAADIAHDAPAPATEPRVAFKQYRDSETGVSVIVPQNWVVTGVVVPGHTAILQSYPENKYVGGEPLAPGDTKCDLNIRPVGVSLADFVQEMRTNTAISILSDAELILASGQMGIRMELESMGRSLALVTEVNGRVVVLTCFGELVPFDAIAVTLDASE